MMYSHKKNKVKNRLKREILSQLTKIEENDLENEEHYNYLKRRLKEIENKEIEGYIRRIKYNAPYEKCEPDISFFSKLEKRKIAEGRINQLAEKQNGEIYTDKKDVLSIATKFYKELYTPQKLNIRKQNQLLRNIKKKLSLADQEQLDQPITEEEVKIAISQLLTGKTPGLDGIPIEFYREFWPEIKEMFMAYINKAKTNGFSNTKNTSLIKLIYKKDGENYLLVNYRPISIINVDVKIICKVLATRLKYKLPGIIHETQTAVYGRKIDQTLHIIQDLIDLANNENEQAAFIFLDQEKAFDRVDHDFLFKVMKNFGIGDIFISWVKTIYANATAMVNINGYFSGKIPLKRGVRQGCPLSPLLYVLVIEVLATQLRTNPNIVGFTIEGEKIVSLHYADDATIIIKQNRCFKEVIKEIEDYEESSGAKINYKKTKGLWVGSWRERRVSPLNIKWTNSNVKILGVYVGNDNPDVSTFKEIVPAVKKRLAYWKQF